MSGCGTFLTEKKLRLTDLTSLLLIILRRFILLNFDNTPVGESYLIKIKYAKNIFANMCYITLHNEKKTKSTLQKCICILLKFGVTQILVAINKDGVSLQLQVLAMNHIHDNKLQG